MLRSSTGGAVTSTVAVVLTVVAASAPSARATTVCSADPEAAAEMSTIAVMPVIDVPAGIGAEVASQVSRRPASLSEQLHPATPGAAAKVSPAGRVA